ncbi:hypothetical protein [Streptomyces sp. NPDC056069]|uniref:hypothetical protein n=1 Tax=Streptomyces sp. NPDC056069 TaxID=3345702 RepID=UPI0035DE6781
MSVYTPQFSPPQTQQPWGQQMSSQLWGLQGQSQQPWSQQGQGQWGQQQPFGMQQGQGMHQLPLLVTELALRCSATAIAAVVEQLRMDPQMLMGIQAQGQVPPQAFSQVLTECARRIAPIVHTALTQLTGQGHQSHMGQQGQMELFPGQGQFGQFSGVQPQSQFGQMQGQGQFPGMQQHGQMPGLGM